MAILEWLEGNALSTLVRETNLFYYLLTAHSVGMGFLVGVNAMLDLRLLSFAPGLPLPAMKKLFPVMWVGFWVNAISGVVLVAAHATEHLRDPVFYIKLTAIALAIVILQIFDRRVFNVPAHVPMPARSLGSAAATDLAELDVPAPVLDPPTIIPEPGPAVVVTTTVRILAVASLVLWAVAITAGRMTAYDFYRGSWLRIWH
jgi:hypothetical protein